MANREEIQIDELIARIADTLAMSMDADDIVQVANDVMDGKFTYLGDENVLVEKETAQ